MEKEDFFAAAALALGPPPAEDHRGIRYGMLVGSKSALDSKPYRQFVAERKFAAQLLSLYIVVMPFEAFMTTDNTELFEEYVKWYRLQNKLRLAAEKI